MPRTYSVNTTKSAIAQANARPAYLDRPTQPTQSQSVVIEHGRRYTDNDVTPTLAKVAIDWIKSYTTAPDANGFMVDMHDKALKNERFSTPQIRAILNWMSFGKTASATPLTPPSQIPTRRPTRTDLTPGTYTVIDPTTNAYTTIELQLADPSRFDNLPQGTMIASYLSGPDNESDYMGFAFIKPQGCFIWKRHQANLKLKDAIEQLACATDDELAEAGYQYALKSGRCYRCRRKLTVPASIHRGLGPVCAGKV